MAQGHQGFRPRIKSLDLTSRPYRLPLRFVVQLVTKKIFIAVAMIGTAMPGGTPAAHAQHQNASPALAPLEPVDFSCADKTDGNYPHPSDPTEFMSCVTYTYAYERDCGWYLPQGATEPVKAIYSAEADAYVER